VYKRTDLKKWPSASREKASQQLEKPFNISLFIRKLETGLIKETSQRENVSIDKQVPRKKGKPPNKTQITPPNVKIRKQTTSS
jgi:UDP-N-acetylglucosamine pyrophosphorylase